MESDRYYRMILIEDLDLVNLLLVLKKICNWLVGTICGNLNLGIGI
jgi:hypothetical protein